MNSRDSKKMACLRHYGFGSDVMKQIKVCPQCGAKANAAQHFCRECGMELLAETLYDVYKQSHRVCPVCDAVVGQDADYCPVCGASLEQAG